MYTITNKSLKRFYSCPEIIEIKLDNEISLALASTPPDGPGEFTNNNAPEYIKNDPFKLV
jgi:hypothetical protein